MADRIRIEAFLEMLSAERGAAQNTLDAYARDLLDASEYLGGQLSSANASELSSLMQDLAKRGLAPATAARRLSALKHFFRFLFEEGDRKDNPTSQLDG
ncbi:MAG: site-specific integrase, partial [Pseudomonadota bacterium]